MRASSLIKAMFAGTFCAISVSFASSKSLADSVYTESEKADARGFADLRQGQDQGYVGSETCQMRHDQQFESF